MRAISLATMALAAGLPIADLAAQERPPLYPTRDVSITYRVTGARAPQGMPNITLSWLAAAQAMRMDMGGMGYLVADHRAQRSFMVMEQMRMVMDLPMENAQTSLPAEGRFRRTGSATVAGLPCTLWNYEHGGDRGTACVTADGVTLRAEGSSGGQSGGMEATQVAYGTQDPARFQRPQGYQTMQMPQGAPAMPRR